MSETDQQIAIDTCISLLKSGSRVQIKMSGNSMFPFIKNGETCIIEPIENIEELKMGDVLVFGNQKKMIAHRLVSIRELNDKTFFYCRGDSRMKPDSAIPSENILGKAIAIIKKGKEIRIEALPGNLTLVKLSRYLIPFYYTYWGVRNLFCKRHPRFLL